MNEVLEIRGYPKGQRIYAVAVFSAAGLFFLWLVWSNPTAQNNWIGFVMAGACFWLAAYWLFLPKVLAIVTTRGVDWLDEDLALLFLHRHQHLDWNKVKDVKTRESSGKGGPFWVTEVVAADSADPQKTRRYRITSQNMEYYRFVDYAKHAVAGQMTDPQGLAMDPVRMKKILFADQILKLAGLFLTSLALLAFLYFFRR
jgi:hypothetical protein